MTHEGTHVRFIKLLAICLLLPTCLFGSSYRTMAASRAATAVVLDPDGDDPRTELLYHWQDKRFSIDERRQMIGCSALVGVVILSTSIRRRIRQKGYTK